VTEGSLIAERMTEITVGLNPPVRSRLQVMRRFLLISLLLLIRGGSLPAVEDLIQETDQLFVARDDVKCLRQAIAILDQKLASQPKDFEVLWRLAKYNYYLADRVTDKNDKSKYYETGIDLAKTSIGINSQRPEGHFWLAANYGEYAQLKGIFKSLLLLRSIRTELEQAFSIDPGFDNGNLYLALGELSLRLPWLVGGNHQRGLELLDTGVRKAPKNADLSLTLAEYYVKDGRIPEARRLLEVVLTLGDPLRSPKEMEELRIRSRNLLKKTQK